MKLDSHHHFWNYDPQQYPWIDDSMSVLATNFLPENLQLLADEAGVRQVISVQARQTVEETAWLAELASQFPELIAGIVGWVPFASENIADILAQLCDGPHGKHILGFRHVVQDEPDDNFLLGDAFNHGISALLPFDRVYDLLIFGRQLPATFKFVDQHPSQRFVLDHIAKPTLEGPTKPGVAAAMDQAWLPLFQDLARRPHVSCKFSGVVTEITQRDHSDWDADTIRPYWDAAWEAFGPDRLMFGSDWPVCLLKSSYERWVSEVERLCESLSESEKDQFWSGSCRNAYQLSS